MTKKGEKRPPFSKEWRQKMSNSREGKPSPRKGVKLTDKTKQKIRNANIGKTLSEETKKKISGANKGRKAWNKGKKLGKRTNHSLQMMGENNPNWKGGISFELYSQDWTDDLKDSIRKRDNYTCQICGLHQDELVKFYKILDIHHIDYNKNNLNPGNLISLCRSCHMKTNYKREYWIKYFSENYV